MSRQLRNNENVSENGELKEMASQELEEVDESLEEVLEEAKDVLLPEDGAFDGRGCRYLSHHFA